MTRITVSGQEFDGECIDVVDDLFLIGRGLECNLILRDRMVALQHARIIRRRNVYWLQDLGSSSGTRVRGKKIVQQKLDTETQFEVGPYILGFQLAGDDNVTREENAAEVARRNLHNQLISELNLRQITVSQMADHTLRQRASDALDELVGRYAIPRGYDVAEIKKAVLDAALGLGPLEDMLQDEGITEIMVNGPKKIYIERNGKLEKSTKSFISKQEVLTAIERIVGPIGRRIDESSPMVDARLADGSRVNAVIPPLALDSPTLTIRKFPKKRMAMSDYLSLGSLTTSMADFLRLCVLAEKNIVISGGTGSGKTTLLNVLSGFIPDNQRIITIEDSAELQLPQEHVVRLETRGNNIEGKGEITIRDLVKNALRMRPNRIIVGECRGGEALDMLQAMNTGHDGSLTTVHANSCADALRRLENLVLFSGVELPLKAVRELIFSAINIIVQIARLSDGSRKLVTIAEVVSLTNGEIQIEEVFNYRRSGVSAEGRVIGGHSATGVVPAFVKKAMVAGIKIDLSAFLSASAQEVSQ